MMNHSRLYKTLQAGLLLLAFLFLAGCTAQPLAGLSQHPSNTSSPQNGIYGEIFDLYSWKDGNGNWMFSLIASFPAAPASDADTVMSKSNTVGDIHALKARLSKLGKRASIVWRNLPGPDSTVVYPPEPVMDDVRKVATESKVFFQVVPALYD